MKQTSTSANARWTKYCVSGVWKNARYGFGCYATDMSSGRTVALVGNEPLALSRGDMVRGQVVLSGDWHGTPMYRMERYVPAHDHVAVVRYMMHKLPIYTHGLLTKYTFGHIIST